MADRTTKVTLLAEVNGYIANMEKAAKSTKKMAGDSAEAMAKQKEAFELVGRASLTAGTLALAGAALAAKAAVDWETAWTGVTKTVDGTPEQLDAIQEGLRGMARELPIAHKELAAVAEAAGQLGVEQGSILEFTRTMVDLGQTTNLSAEEAATAIAQMMNVMQSAPEDVDRLGAALVQLGNNGASTERDIIMMASRISGAGKTVGLTEAEVLGLANALSSVGIEVEAGGSAISKIMIDIAKSVSAGGKDLDEFAKVAGVSSEDFARSFKGAPADAIATFVEGLGRIDKEGGDVFATLETLGQTDIRTTRALLNMANSGDVLRNSLELGNEAWDENTALVEEANKRYDTTASKIQVATNGIVDAAIAMGQVFLPAINAASDGISDLTEDLSTMNPVVSGTVGVVTVLGGVAALSGGAFLLAVPKIAAYRAALVTLGPVAQRTSRALGVVGKAAGVLLAIAFVHEMRSWTDGMTGATKSADDLQESLGNVHDTAKTVDDVLAAGGTMFGWSANASGNLDALSSDFGQFTADIQNSWAGTAFEFATLGAGDTSLGAAKKNIEELDTAMANLVAGGKTKEASAAWEELIAQTDGSEESIDKLKKLFPQYEAALDGATDGTVDNTEAIAELEGAAEGAGDQISDLADMIRNFGATSLSARDAERAFEAAIDDATDAVIENGKTLDITTEAGRNNEAALDGIARAALESAASILEQTGSQEDATKAITDGRAALVEQLAKFGITGDAADKYIDRLGLIPGNISTAVEINTDPADAAMAKFLNRWTGSSINLTATGSDKLGSGVLGYASGGTVRGPGTSKSDSVPAMLSVGEEVTPEPQASKYRPVLKAIQADTYTSAMFAPAPPAATVAQGGPTSVTITAPAIETQDPLVYGTIIGREFARRLAG
jgi:TP901 family phage tail tape measure protein